MTDEKNTSGSDQQSTSKGVDYKELHRTKKWQGYLFEFVMLFLAISLGFFVENLREDYSEHQQELQYIKSMVEDLKQDTLMFNKATQQKKIAAQISDSVILLLSLNKKSKKELQRLYYLARIIPFNIGPYLMNDRTYDQMKSSGNLRLIQSPAVADSISRYYFIAKDLSTTVSQTQMRLQLMLELQGKVFDGTVFRKITEFDKFTFQPSKDDTPLMTEDKKIVNELIVSTHYVTSILAFTKIHSEGVNLKAKRLLNLLQTEYHLDRVKKH